VVLNSELVREMTNTYGTFRFEVQLEYGMLYLVVALSCTRSSTVCTDLRRSCGLDVGIRFARLLTNSYYSYTLPLPRFVQGNAAMGP
jgi:hypothetical protein